MRAVVRVPSASQASMEPERALRQAAEVNAQLSSTRSSIWLSWDHFQVWDAKSHSTVASVTDYKSILDI